MLEKEIELLNSIATPAVQATISAYTRWYQVSSAIWILFGLTVVFGAAGFYRREDTQFEGKVGAIAAMLIGALFISANIPDLFHPDAMAIHRLLRDLAGK